MGENWGHTERGEVQLSQPGLRKTDQALVMWIDKSKQKWCDGGRLPVIAECLDLRRRLVEIKVYNILPI